MPARVTVRWLEDGVLQEAGRDGLPAARFSGHLWVDVAEADEESLAWLAGEFGLHPLTIEDCLHPQRRAKLDVYPEHLFIVWIMPMGAAQGRLVIDDAAFFLGPDFLLSVHRDGYEAIAEVAKDASESLGRGLDWTLYKILDHAVDHLLELADSAGDPLERLEDEMIDGVAGKDQLLRLRQIRTVLVALHRVVSPERDVLRALVREERLVGEDSYRYVDDVGDHLARAEDSIEMTRDMAAAAMDVYLSTVSNRLNQVMKQLTIVATIFMPLTLISGIYGMNLLGTSRRWAMWPPPDSAWGFAFVVALMGAVAVGMLLYFRRKDWW